MSEMNELAEQLHAAAMQSYEQGALRESEQACRAILTHLPGHGASLHLLGLVYLRAGLADEAIDMLRRAVRQSPRNAAWCANLGVALKRKGERLMSESGGDAAVLAEGQGFLDEALRQVNKAIRLQPKLTDAQFNRAMLLKMQGNWKEALQSLRHVVRLLPECHEAWNEIGHLHMMSGNPEAAKDAFLRAAASPEHGAQAYSNFLLALNYQCANPDEVLAQHRQWACRFADGIASFDSWPNAPRESRRLKIGYVSPDFHSHSVAFFAEPLLRTHDRARFEVHCYSASTRRDAMHERLRGLADVWRDTAALDDPQLARCVREDGIDILIDLSGHTSKNRLRVFAMQPAPVQASYIGYPNTTGLSAIQWRITDAIADPPGADAWYSEKLVRLSGGFLRFSPPDAARKVSREASDAQVRRPGVTFGSFNLLAKMSDACLKMWADVLHAVPDSRLFIKNVAMVDADVRSHLLSRFRRLGIAKERLEFAPWNVSLENHFRAYRDVDIALDTFPYNGTTTTCEALYMGVPVVSRAGNVHAARVGASLLSRVQLGELVAETSEDFVRICARLANDREHLLACRRTAHAQTRRVLCDAESWIGELEGGYRMMWRQWCMAQRGELFPKVGGEGCDR